MAMSYTYRMQQAKIPVLHGFERESHGYPCHHSGGTLVDPELLKEVALSLGWKEYLHHVGGSQGSPCKEDLSQAEGEAKKDGRLSLSQPWIPWAVNFGNHEKYCTQASGR